MYRIVSIDTECMPLTDRTPEVSNWTRLGRKSLLWRVAARHGDLQTIDRHRASLTAVQIPQTAGAERTLTLPSV